MMQRGISRTSSIIPELYWDLISRISPGLLFILGGILLGFKYTYFKNFEQWAPHISSFTLLILVFLLSYIFGLLIDSLGQILNNLLKKHYDPVVDILAKSRKTGWGKNIFGLLEVILGLPFSLFKLKDYKPVKLSNKRIDEINSQIQEEVGSAKDFSKVIQVLYFIKMSNESMYSTVFKFRAEAIMTRNVAVVVLMFLLFSAYHQDFSLVVVEWLFFALCISVFSVKRRTSILRIFETFLTVKKSIDRSNASVPDPKTLKQ